MNNRKSAAACAVMMSLTGHVVAAETGTWVLTYENKSTNQLTWDHRMNRLVETHLPAALAEKVGRALGGPPEPVVVVSNRYASASACVPHSCGDKGFFWIDTKTGASLGASAIVGVSTAIDSLLLGSNSLRADTIPAPARAALMDWLSENAIASTHVAFVGADNVVTPVAATDFQPRTRFTPQAGGPGFDCAAAHSAVETTICADPALSRLDLDMQHRFDDGQRSYATVPARAERRALQRQWLKERDSACGAATEREACLAHSYAVQTERLDNFLPSH
jgi:uncharacterized protein YecT (DUF1311 family)